MTNTPMTFEEWYKQFETSEGINLLCEESARRGWSACEEQEEQSYDALLTDYNSVRESRDSLIDSQAQQAQTIAELVEALEASSQAMHECAVSDLTSDRLAYNFMDARKMADDVLAKVKGK